MSFTGSLGWRTAACPLGPAEMNLMPLWIMSLGTGHPITHAYGLVIPAGLRLMSHKSCPSTATAPAQLRGPPGPTPAASASPTACRWLQTTSQSLVVVPGPVRWACKGRRRWQRAAAGGRAFPTSAGGPGPMAGAPPWHLGLRRWQLPLHGAPLWGVLPQERG